MLEESTFTEEDIINETFENYNIKIKNIERINEGTANIYKVTNNMDKYILKELQSKYSKEDVKREIEAIRYLQKNSSIPLPEFIQCKDKEFYFIHKGKTVFLQKFIDGHTCKKNEGNHEQLIESAQYLGRIVKGFEGFKTEQNVTIQDWYSKNEFEKANKKYDLILNNNDNSELGKKIKDDILFKKVLLQKISNTINIAELDKITCKVSHGDYNCLQFIYDENNKIKAILDFIKTKKLPIVWEIARSYSYIDSKTKNGNINVKNLVDYTKEVAKFINLNTYDLKYLPYIYLIQLARSPFGYEQYYKNVKNKEELLEFAFYRTKICRDLYDKAEQISKQLLN